MVRIGFMASGEMLFENLSFLCVRVCVLAPPPLPTPYFFAYRAILCTSYLQIDSIINKNYVCMYG